MNTKLTFNDFDQDIVYVKPVAVADLPEEVQSDAGDLDLVYAVHDSAGQQLALVADKSMAFHLARQHDKAPVVVH